MTPKELDDLLFDLTCNHDAMHRDVSIYSRASDAIRLLRERDKMLGWVMHTVQQHQPAGSPAPGDEQCLAAWVLARYREQVQKLTAERDEWRRKAHLP